MLRSALHVFISTGLILWPSCRGGAAAVSELPSPMSDDRPPGYAPELPRLSVELPKKMAAPTRVLETGEDLQDAIDKAKPGDVIALTPRATFKGPITLPNKQGSDWITIRTRIADGVFPSPGTRVNPSHASLMPIIESGAESAIIAASGAHHYRLVGIEVRPKAGVFLHNLIALGTDETSLDALPHHIVFERCYLHGDPKLGTRRGIALNSRYTAVTDSYLSDFKEQGADSQAIAGWNGLGPFAIVNNYLEASGENVMFGGADPSVKNLVPSDIQIRRNHFAKPLAWKSSSWTVKNLLELKSGRRVLIEGNILENNWPQAQNGFAILFTPRNQDGEAPWSMVRDVTFIKNIVRHSGSGINISGKDDNRPSQQTKRILIRNNLFEDIDGARWGGAGRLFQLLNGTSDVVIDHNSAFQSGDAIVADGDPNQGFVYTNNLTPQNQYGVGGSGTFGNPIATLATYFPGAKFVNNIMVGGTAHYPPGNFIAATWADVGFADFAGRDYRLARSSRYKAAGTDGKDVGADIQQITAAVQP